MQITLEQAEQSQAEALTSIAMSSKAHWGYSEDFMQQCEAELEVTQDKLNSAEFDFVVAKDGQTLLGFYALQTLPGGHLEIDALFVLPAFMGQGVGKRLFQHAMSRAADKNAPSVDIQSDPHAEDFYLAMGAELVGRRPSDSIAGRELPLLRIQPGE